MKYKFAFLVFLTFFLAACAHTPTRGERMMAQSNDTEELANQWKQGEQLISTGKSMQNKANKLIGKGNQQIF